MKGRVIIGIAASFTALLLAILYYQQLGAVDWSAGEAKLHSSEQVTDFLYLQCATSIQRADISGDTVKRDVCMQKGEHIKFGRYINAAGRYRAAVSFGIDAKMYPVEGVCYERNDCIYVESRDMLIVKQYISSRYFPSLFIYKDVSKRLQKILREQSLTFYYKFDTSSPEYVLRRTSTDYATLINSMAVSRNGNWLAVELVDAGLARINLDTLKLKRFSNDIRAYNYGRNPQIEFAITNDGKTVVVVGALVGFSMYNITQSCGDLATDQQLDMPKYMENPCTRGFVDPKLTDDFFEARNPVFSEDDGQLSLIVDQFSVSHERAVLYANGYDPKPLGYLALGDSFSSGEGETDDTYYQPFTNNEFEKCHTSTRSYPYLVGSALGISAGDVHSVACSAARIKDINSLPLNYWGQASRLLISSEEQSYQYRYIQQTFAEQSFIPGRILQSKFVQLSQPMMLTVGISGNDIGFMDKLKACVTADTCEWAGTEEGREKTALEIKGIFDNLVGLYGKLKKDSPLSSNYVIGYPQIVSLNGSCTPLTAEMFDPTERVFMREGIHYFNDVIEAAATKAGVHYIDIENAYGEEALCGTKGGAMNGLRTGDDFSPIESMRWLKVLGAESFHPTPLGHELAAKLISREVKQLTGIIPPCADETVTCDIEVPEPSNYWVKDGVIHGYDRQVSMTFTSSNIFMPSKLQIKLNVNNFILNPLSDVRVEVHSDPRLIGHATVTENGGLDLTVNLPSDLPYGFHTLHIFGSSYSGEPIDLYEVIAYAPDSPVASLDGTESKTINEASSGSSNNKAEVVLTDIAQNDVLDAIDQNNDVLGATDVALPDSPAKLAGLTDGSVQARTGPGPWHYLLASTLIPAGIVVGLFIRRVLRSKNY